MKTVNKNQPIAPNIRRVTGAFAAVFLTLCALPSKGHETRIIANDAGDQLKMIVGNNPEPVLEDSVYHTDLFLRQVVTSGDAEEDVPVNTGAEGSSASIENLDIHVLLLKDDQQVTSVSDPLVLKKMQLENVRLRFGEEDRYGTPIKYTHDGAYGFYFHGTVVTNDGTVFPVDEIFVCGGGSFAEPREDGSVPAFGCVEDAVTFPGNNGSRDRASYRDSDKYSLEEEE